ncbi:ATP-binding protein [Silvimonas amylolytica]|nr:ATP-binding protein [Silvimonas amylolytica]
MPRLPRSLGGRLMTYCLISLVLITTIVLGGGYAMARQRSERWFDHRLKESTELLLAFELDKASPNHVGPHAASLPIGPFAVQIFGPDGKLLFASLNAPKWPFVRQPGYSNRDIGDTTWRAYTEWDTDGDFQVRVMEDYADHDQFLHLLARRQIVTLLLVLPVVAAALFYSVRRGLQPLRDLSQQLDEFDPNHPQHFETETLVEELQKPAIALNALLDRVDAMLERERRFTSDAAHELRTPFAALLVQAEVARTTLGEDRREHALRAVEEAARRGGHLVEQLLALARLDRAERLPREIFDLASLSRNTIAELAGRAADKDQQLSFTAPERLLFIGHAVAVSTALRNLVENAIRYTPRTAQISVTLQTNPGGVELLVQDNGPGIEPALRERVLDRFYRPPGAAEDGCGLGLSLVAQAVTLHGGTLILEDAPQQGLQVRVSLPHGPLAVAV